MSDRALLHPCLHVVYQASVYTGAMFYFFVKYRAEPALAVVAHGYGLAWYNYSCLRSKFLLKNISVEFLYSEGDCLHQISPSAIRLVLFHTLISDP